jgi:hypothetical protein
VTTIADGLMLSITASKRTPAIVMIISLRAARLRANGCGQPRPRRQSLLREFIPFLELGEIFICHGGFVTRALAVQ